MKIIILFALASVSVCTEPPEEWSTSEQYVRTFDRCDSFVNEYADDENCLLHAFQNVPELLEIAKKLICKHRRNELDRRFIYYAEFKKELSDFMGCTGCAVGEAAGLEELLGRIGAAVGITLGIATELMGELTLSTGVFEIVFDFICVLLTGELTSEIVDLLSINDLTSKEVYLEKLFCMAKKEILDVPLTIELLRSAGLLQNKFLGLEEELENLPADVGQTLNSLLKPVLTEVMEIPGVADLLGNVLCPLWNLVGGVLDNVADTVG